MIDDAELLRRYVRDDSEESFSALVRLRAGFVYAIALRRVGGDRHLANDVTQQVFIALARNARRLSGHPVPSGWLFLTTRNIAIQTVRSEQRRKKREKESASMYETDATTESSPEETGFRENLDDVLHELNERDRQAVLLRFFEGRSFAEIAVISSLTENAARMRVERALEKLNTAFSKRGITSAAVALGARLTAHAGTALPPSLTATFAHTALASTGVGAGVWGITFMSMTKLQISAIIMAALGIGGVVFHEHSTAALKRQIDRLEKENKELTERQNHNLRPEQTAPATLQAHVGDKAAVTSPKDSSVHGSVTGAMQKRGSVALAAGLSPVEKLDHSNRSSARAAFSTQIWAAAEGDVDLEQSSILLTKEAREKFEALLATLPASDRERYGPPERLMASVLAGSPHPVGGVQILDEKIQRENDVVLETQWQHADDMVVHHSNVELQRDASGNWQMVVPMVLVDRAVAYLSRNFNPPAVSQKNRQPAN